MSQSDLNQRVESLLAAGKLTPGEAQRLRTSLDAVRGQSPFRKFRKKP